jgi:DNA helicase-2/ATP-dependent DNA helicase PcrA
MTLHSAKGLEFPVVVVSGLEDGLLPHFNSQGTDDALEEERRLLYVGMTRARERLFLSCCRRRRIAGRYQNQHESPFLEEIPEDLLKVTQSPEIFSTSRFQGVYSFFGDDRGDGDGLDRGYSDDSEAGLGKGTRVRHPTLGQGVVLEVDGSGDHAKITVFFERSGKRKLVAKYANLEAL